MRLVGGGLVGSLLASFLARRGHEVEVYERRPDLRRSEKREGRSINLAVSLRGLFALRELGLEDEVLRHAIPMRGRMIHPLRGEVAFQRYGKDDSESIHSISRETLNQILMTRAEETRRVRFHFNRRVTEYRPERGILTVLDSETGESSEVVAPVVIGTDGSASAIRRAFESRPEFEHREEVLAHGYKELTIPAGPGGSFLLEKHALHIWPRGNFMVIALPNFDGSFTVTLFLPLEGAVSFAALGTPAAVEGFFREFFPDVLAQVPHLVSDFFAHPTGKMGTVKCFPWNLDGRAMLLGDAAHAMVPFFGQGMNCGFEDCSVFDREPDGDWAEVFERVARARKPQTDAISDMAIENFVEMSAKTADPRFLLEKEVERILMAEFPGEYLSRYALVTFSRIPYRTAYDLGKIQADILAELCVGLERAADVDREMAAKRIRAKLTPFMRRIEWT
jgi:kynurenine 3-monooxygenase